MTEQETAKDLVKQHFFAINGDYEHIKTNGEDWLKAVRGALITVNEIIKLLEITFNIIKNTALINWWQEVKKQIELL